MKTYWLFPLVIFVFLNICFSQTGDNIALQSNGATSTDNGHYVQDGVPLDASRAIDNDTTTYWAGLQSSIPQTMTITFDKTYEISRVIILELYPNGASYFTNADFEYNDGSGWQPLFSATKSQPGLDRTFNTISALQVRMKINSVVTPGSWANKVACISAFEIYSNEIGDDNPVAYYPFNNNANDESGNGNHGTVYGATITTDRFGNPNSAYEFDGVDDEINIGSQLKPSFPISVSTWVSVDDLTGGGIIFRNDQWNGYAYYRGVTLQYNELGKIYVAVGNGFAAPWTRRDFLTVESLISTNEWCHIVAIYNSYNNMQIFFNGVEHSTEPGNGTATGMSYSDADGAIGSRYSGGQNIMVVDGIVDDVGIYNYALSADKIDSLFGKSGIDLKIEIEPIESFHNIFDNNIAVFPLKISNLGNQVLSTVDIEVYLQGNTLSVMGNLNDIGVGGYRTFYAYSDPFNVSQENLEFEVEVTSANNKSVNFSMIDTVSFYFCKSNEDQPFKLNRDGYRFPNPSKLSFSEFVLLLGKYNVVGVTSYLYKSLANRNGRCYGMSASAGSYYLYPFYKPYDTIVHDWQDGDVLVMDNISIYHIQQALWNLGNDFDHIHAYNSLKDRLENYSPVMLDLKSHATLVTGLVNYDSGWKSIIYGYDSNFRDLTVIASFEFPDQFNWLDTYNDFAVYPENAFIPFSLDILYNKVLANISTELNEIQKKVFSTACPVNLLVSNSKGERIGIDDGGILYNEIPNSEIIRLPTENSLNDSLTILMVPGDEIYSAKMFGDSVGSMRFEYYSPDSNNTLKTAIGEGINITGNTICTFDENNKDFIIEIDKDGDGIVDSTVSMNTTVVKIDNNKMDGLKAPEKYYLLQNYPNPFNPVTIIEFFLPKAEFVTLEIFNIIGEKVTSLISKKLKAGNHSYEFDGSNLPSGIYLYRIKAGEFNKVRKMILVR